MSHVMSYYLAVLDDRRNHVEVNVKIPFLPSLFHLCTYNN